MRTSAWGTGAEPAGSARVFVLSSISLLEVVDVPEEPKLHVTVHIGLLGRTSVTRYDISQLLFKCFLSTHASTSSKRSCYRRLKRLSF